MLFHKPKDKWEPVNGTRQLEEAVKTAGAGLFLFSFPVAAALVITLIVFVFLHVANPIMSTVGLAIQYWHVVVFLPIMGVVIGLQFGWHTSGSKSFEILTVDLLSSIEARLESIGKNLNAEQPYVEEIRSELSGISEGLKRLDQIEEEIRSGRD
jgi:hypothetical protein